MSAERPVIRTDLRGWVGADRPKDLGYSLAATPASIPAIDYGMYLNDVYGGVDPEAVHNWLGLGSPGAWQVMPPQRPQGPSAPQEGPENALAQRGGVSPFMLNVLRGMRG